jgi:hypothetical protein
MFQRLARVATPLAAFGIGALCATSVGIAVAGTSSDRPAVASKVSTVKTHLVRRKVTVKAGKVRGQYADCPKGEIAISGGAGWDDGA